MKPITISEGLRAEVERRKGLILDKIALVAKAESKLEQTQKQYDELSAELERDCDPLDTDQVIRRQALLTQVPALEAMIPQLELEIPKLKHEVSWVAGGTKGIIAAALESFRVEILEMLTKTLLPFHKSADAAEKCAKQTEAWLDLYWFCFAKGWGISSESLAALDDLLAGKNPWHFESAETATEAAS